MSAPRGRKILLGVGLSLLPAAWTLRTLAFRSPETVERLYGEAVYPWIVQWLGEVNRIVPFSLAEMVLAGAVAALSVRVLFTAWRRRRELERRRQSLGELAFRGGSSLWVLAGAVALVFHLFWGLNYARPSLESRLGLPVDEIRPDEVVAAGRECARLTTALHGQLGVPPSDPTRLTMDFADLDRHIDEKLNALRLPGDYLRRTSPSKRLLLSPLLSYLGVSGIYIPFTGEPSINGYVPDPSVPVVVAHEKAHQRGFTNEGEANLVAFLACSRSEEPYVRYAAYLSASVHLLAAASRYHPGEAAAAWQELGEGPRRDLAAIREFWLQYEGRATRMAERINNTYLRSNMVPGGIQSYRQVVRLLVALDRRGELVF